MWVSPNHPVMDDHFSIETHGELGNLRSSILGTLHLDEACSKI